MRIARRLLAVIVVFASVHAFTASAAIYTHTSASGSTNWSAGTSWAPSAPVSFSANSLVFFENQAASAAVVSNNDSRPGANGVVELTPFEFLDRLADLVPPPRKHRHRYHGVFAPNHKPRSWPAHRLGRARPDP
jgi:hypothetical protein